MMAGIAATRSNGIPCAALALYLECIDRLAFRMKREARLLLDRAVDSLVLAIEHFNRPDDRGRVNAVLILMNHAFEMFLKAAIRERGGRIREKRKRETIGFDACVRKLLSDAQIKLLSEEQALTLQAINGIRDSAQHHLVDISERQLYLHAQSGVTLFQDLMREVFGEELRTKLPERVLPVSSTPPGDLTALFAQEVEEISRLLEPGRRKRTEAYARLRPLAIFDSTMRGEKTQPSEGEMKKLAEQLSGNVTWEDVFPGAAAVHFSTEGDGQTVKLRLTKKEGVPVQLVGEGTPGASVVAVKRVNELDFYNLGRDQLAHRVGLTGPKTTAVVRHLGLEEDPDYCKTITIGRSKFKRFSQKMISAIQNALKEKTIEDIWEEYKRAAR